MHTGDTFKPSIHVAERRVDRARRRWACFHGSSASSPVVASATIVLKRGFPSPPTAPPTRLRSAACRPPRSGNSASSSVTSRNVQTELLSVGEPRRVIRSDQLAAAFDVLAGHQIGEAEHTATDAVARFDHRHVVAGARQLVRRGQPAEPGADDDRPSRRAACGPATNRSLRSSAAAAVSERCDHLRAA